MGGCGRRRSGPGRAGAAGADRAVGCRRGPDGADRLTGGYQQQPVIAWKHRYREQGLGGLDDRPKPGRPPVIDEAQIVIRTLEAPPERLGVTHWSCRLLGTELGLSHVTIVKAWKKWDLQPWRLQTFKLRR